MHKPTNYFSDRTHFTKVRASASETCVLAGIGTAPHTPLPPFNTFCVNLFSASFCPAYFAATSLKAGPTTLFEIEWQVIQFFALANSSGLANAAFAVTMLPNAKHTNKERFINFSKEFLLIVARFNYFLCNKRGSS
jgi:hypothetical protein